MNYGLKKSKLAILFVCILAINLLVYLLPFRAIYPEVSGNGTFAVSDTSKRYLKTVSEDVELIYHTSNGRASVDRDVYAFLLKLAAQSPHVKTSIETTDTADFIEIRSAKRSRSFSIYDLFYYKNSILGISFSVLEYTDLMQSIYAETDESYRAQMLTYYASGNTIGYFSADANLTNAIRYVLAESAPSLLLCGKGTDSVSFFLRQELEQAGYSIQLSQALTAIPEETDTLVLNPKSDLTQEECSVLSDYLSKGGSMVLTTSCTALNLPNLYSLLSLYGLSAPSETRILYDASKGQSFSAITENHHSTDLLQSDFAAYYAHPIFLTETEGVEHSVLFRSTVNTYSFNALDSSSSLQGLTPDSYVFGAVAKKGNSKITWISQPFDSISNTVSSGANFEFAKSLLEWMNDYSGQAISVSGKPVPSDYCAPSDTTFIVWTVIFVLILPVTILGIGLFRRQLRQKQ